MRILSRRTFIALLCGTLVLLGLLPSVPVAAPAERTARLTILQINDVYEISPVEKGKKGGLARVATLRAALENGLSQVERTAGRFPQVSGIRFTFDPRRPAGSRLVSVTVSGRPLEPQARYTLATFDFFLEGRDSYTMLKEGKVLVKAENGPMVSDVLIDRLKAGPIAPVPDGRIQRVP